METELRGPIQAARAQDGPWVLGWGLARGKAGVLLPALPPSPKAPSAAQPAPTCSGDDPSWPHTRVLDNRVSLIAGQGLGQGGGRRRGDTLGGLRELASEETWGAESGSGPG